MSDCRTPSFKKHCSVSYRKELHVIVVLKILWRFKKDWSKEPCSVEGRLGSNYLRGWLTHLCQRGSYNNFRMATIEHKKVKIVLGLGHLIDNFSLAQELVQHHDRGLEKLSIQEAQVGFTFGVNIFFNLKFLLLLITSLGSFLIPPSLDRFSQDGFFFSAPPPSAPSSFISSVYSVFVTSFISTSLAGSSSALTASWKHE